MKTLKLPNLSVDVAAYTAGIVDGEGCFQSRMNRSGSCTPELAISQRDKCVIVWLGENLPVGRIKMVMAHGKPLWRCLITRREELVYFIPQIFPFLQLKRIQAVATMALAQEIDKEEQVWLHCVLKDQKFRYRLEDEWLTVPNPRLKN